MKKQSKTIESMDLPKLFELVFCENVFNRSKKRDVVDRREAAYLFMRNLKMGWTEIGRKTGRSHSTVISGVRHFEGLLEVNDPRAKQTWDEMTSRIDAITDETGLPTIEIAVRVDKE
jgi:DNA-binding transcriptional regulator GbsR (MarR family)